MLENIKKYHVVLASKSPRRQELLSGLGIDFTVKIIPGIDESYPDSLPAADVAQYISEKKAAAYKAEMDTSDLIFTADTVVIVGDKILGKPKDAADAHAMLESISGRTHSVVTGVTITTTDFHKSFSVETEVTFASLSSDEIDHYIETYRPYDKAGAYGIQEWIGYIGVTSLASSYYNVMGLPVQRIYSELKGIV